ncbi:MAG: response regulator, partial [Chitinivibrionales bacterium]|nr:response regulator [Chitinivibrionales bacterium]MBD3394430.1 response regulator [Chitinivibrionales bacterium]
LLESIEGFDITSVPCTSVDEIAGMLESRSIDVAFISYRMDAANGFGFLKAIRRADESIPIVILTSRGDEHITAEILRQGASDYLAKDELSSLRVRRLIEQFAAGLSNQREKRLAETILRLNEANYRTLIDNILDVVFVHRDGNIVFANKAIEAILGFNENEVIGKSVLDFVATEKDRKTVLRNMQRRSSGEPVDDYEIGVLDKKGSVHTMIVRASSTMFSDKPAFQVVLIDITERKRVEGELLKAQKLESLGILAGGIAHDFNNILTGIVSGVAAAKMKLESGTTVHELLEQVEKAAFKASALTQELLTFSQGGEPVREPASIRELVRQTIKLPLHGSNVTYSLDLPDDLLTVVMDKHQMGQVLSNLFLNASQAMPGGGKITIQGSNVMIGEVSAPSEIEVKAIDETVPLGDGLYVKIEVRDTGMGIPPGNLERIFDPYFTTKSGGTGLGLATVYSVMQKHKGHVTVHSDIGQGTTFVLYLPATLERAAEEKVREGRSGAPGGSVLVMDDDNTILFTMQRFLSAVGYTVTCVKDGEQAVREYRAASDRGEPFSAAILDLTIPAGMGGKETVKELLTLDPDARAIVISGYSDDPILANYKDHGFVGVLRKPFKPDELDSLLRQVARP